MDGGGGYSHQQTKNLRKSMCTACVCQSNGKWRTYHIARSSLHPRMYRLIQGCYPIKIYPQGKAQAGYQSWVFMCWL